MRKTFEHLFYHGTVLLHFHSFHIQLLPYSEQQLWLGKKDSSYVQSLLHPNKILQPPPKRLQKVYDELFQQT